MKGQNNGGPTSQGAAKPKKAATKPRAKKAEAPATVEAIKGFKHDLTCRGFQFEIGKE